MNPTLNLSMELRREARPSSSRSSRAAALVLVTAVAAAVWWLHGLSSKADKVDKKVDDVAVKVEKLDDKVTKMEGSPAGSLVAPGRPAIVVENPPLPGRADKPSQTMASRKAPTGCHPRGEGLECRFGKAVERVSRRVWRWACGRRPTQAELDAESAVIAIASHAPICRESTGRKRLIVQGAPDRLVYVSPVDCRGAKAPDVEACPVPELASTRGDPAAVPGGRGTGAPVEEVTITDDDDAVQK
jgi:hypothetical protein